MADTQRTVVFAIYPDATLLDFAGSLQVFTTASDIGRRPPASGPI